MILHVKHSLEYVAIETEVTLNFIECTHEQLILVK